MRHLATRVPCRRCGREVYVAICRDGKWRAFEENELPAGTEGAWAWRKRQGMEETTLVPGHPQHMCPKWHERPEPEDYTLPGWLGAGGTGIDISGVRLDMASGEPADVVRHDGDGWTWVCAGCGTIATGDPADTSGNRWYCERCAT